MSERIAVVGAGYWAQFQFEGWRDAGAPVAAMWAWVAMPAGMCGPI